jgi:hypothetical protein
MGPGSALSDSLPVMASNGEHMWTAHEVVAAGGHANVTRIRQAVLSGSFRKSGGPVGYTAQTFRVSTASSTAAGGEWADRLVEALRSMPAGDVHLHMNAVLQNGEPLGLQASKGARRIERFLSRGR